jgi:CRISPR-associated protein Cas5t
VQSLFQQLHNYPVGRDAGMPAEMAMGNKNNITPVRRELLVGLSAIIAIDDQGQSDLEQRVPRGLRGDLNAGRYGLPFLGDNSFLIDRIDVVSDALPVRWYERIEAKSGGPRPHVTRLTHFIDRADMSRTLSALYAPASVSSLEPSEAAWQHVGPVAASRDTEEI